ncbi:MAG: cupin domain-containing protein [Chloroflexota bacterium]
MDMAHRGFMTLAREPEVELAPGVFARFVPGERGMLSFVRFAEGGVVPDHEHPHEQLGTMLEGALYLTIGEETRLIRTGEAYVIPPHTRHSAWVPDGERCLALDVFVPLREDYMDRLRQARHPER